MENSTKIVMQIPLTKLWNDSGDVIADRVRHLTTDEIQGILKSHTVQFVVADVGAALKWIDIHNTFEFWKAEIKPHLADDYNKVKLENFIGNYAFVASEWAGDIEVPIILLEKHH
ncbi:MAG: hypothetical protein RL660_1407 [Bacteroidota bacterium]|jgi:hypothetical protein